MCKKDYPCAALFSFIRLGFFCALFTGALECVSTPSELDSALHRYDVVSLRDISHKIVKRSINSKYPDVKQIEFDTLGRHFHLYLQKKAKVVGSGFKVVAVNDKQEEREVAYTTDNFYNGIDLADPYHSEVNVYYEEDSTISAKIKTSNDTYYLEPNRGRVPDQNEAMIAYKESDVKMDDEVGGKYCGYVHPDHDEAAFGTMNKQDTEHETSDRTREKRQIANAPTRTKCTLMLVADYKFFRNVGQSSVSSTASYLIGLVDRVDSIYMDTDFGNGYKGMGFEIKEIRVHEAPNDDPTHYNGLNETPDTKELLNAFSEMPILKQFCLGHLFTYQGFVGGVLGLAYIASPRPYSVGGVCTQAYYTGGRQLFLNTGWSSSLNRAGRRLLTSEADLVSAHEFGHNWGSEHDPDTSECSPGGSSGGKHIMYTYAVSGYDSNNKLFSPCSRRSIGAVLASKSDNCFDEPEDAYCGNGRVEKGEQCDVGSVNSNDPCCDSTCRLRSNAVCSDQNDICCSGCQFAPSGFECHVAQNESCEMSAYCTGNSKDCPEPESKNDGDPCHNRGTCKEGRCLSLCESVGMMSCICDAVDESCHYCCRSETQNCTQYLMGGSIINLPEGVPCLQGYCTAEGECEKNVQDLVERIWEIFNNLTPSTFVALMRANIVGTVIVLSLLLWIPISCIISKLDRMAEEREHDRMDIAMRTMSKPRNTFSTKI